MRADSAEAARAWLRALSTAITRANAVDAFGERRARRLTTVRGYVHHCAGPKERWKRRWAVLDAATSRLSLFLDRYGHQRAATDANVLGWTVRVVNRHEQTFVVAPTDGSCALFFQPLCERESELEKRAQDAAERAAVLARATPWEIENGAVPMPFRKDARQILHDRLAQESPDLRQWIRSLREATGQRTRRGGRDQGSSPSVPAELAPRAAAGPGGGACARGSSPRPPARDPEKERRRHVEGVMARWRALQADLSLSSGDEFAGARDLEGESSTEYLRWSDSSPEEEEADEGRVRERGAVGAPGSSGGAPAGGAGTDLARRTLAAAFGPEAAGVRTMAQRVLAMRREADTRRDALGPLERAIHEFKDAQALFRAEDAARRRRDEQELERFALPDGERRRHHHHHHHHDRHPRRGNGDASRRKKGRGWKALRRLRRLRGKGGSGSDASASEPESAQSSSSDSRGSGDEGAETRARGPRGLAQRLLTRLSPRRRGRAQVPAEEAPADETPADDDPIRRARGRSGTPAAAALRFAPTPRATVDGLCEVGRVLVPEEAGDRPRPRRVENPINEAAADAPAVDDSATDASAKNAPRTDAPAVEVPASEAPPKDACVAEAPAAETRGANVSAATDVPATDAPATDAPATDAPATDVLATDGPAAAAQTGAAADGGRASDPRARPGLGAHLDGSEAADAKLLSGRSAGKERRRQLNEARERRRRRALKKRMIRSKRAGDSRRRRVGPPPTPPPPPMPGDEDEDVKRDA
jgi:hypothetical protein